jgi:hypothetical protein
MPTNQRQKIGIRAVIANRHKPIRSFLTNFEKNFSVLAQKYLTRISPFIYRGAPEACYQFESIRH